MSEKILLVDDEQPIITLLNYHFTKAGYVVVKAMDGEEALHYAIAEKPDLLVLDVMLPKKDGLEVCKELKIRQEKAALLMLTANDDELDKIIALEIGADDYMTKPFSPREVVARAKAILRRMKNLPMDQNERKTIQLRDLTIIPEKHEAYFYGEKLELTRKEYELLLQLAKNKGKVVTRDKLLEDIWGNKLEGESRIVDVHISHLREKMKTDQAKTITISTIRGLGYKLEDPFLSC